MDNGKMEALGRPELWTIRTHLFPWPFSIANSSARGFRWIQDMQSLSVYLKCIIKTWTFPQTQLPHLPFIRKINLAFGRDVFLTPSNHLFSSVKTYGFLANSNAEVGRILAIPPFFLVYLSIQRPRRT